MSTKQCKICGKEITGRRITCGGICQRTVSPETRKLLSEKQKQFLKENPEKHTWKRKGKKNSVPCNKVKEYLSDRGIQFIEEFTPLEDRMFSIDIAFPHIMTGIEINGNQHYDSTGKLKPYYQKRHDLITKAGWKLIEVHYSQCFSDEKINQFLNFEVPYDDSGIIQRYFDEKRARDELKKNKLPRGEKIKQKNRQKWESRKNEIFDHGIDFSKYGWVSIVAKILGLHPQKVNKWMKQYHSEFYEQQCFKRKVKTDF